MPKYTRKGKGNLKSARPQGMKSDQVLLSWLKEPGNYARFTTANGRNVKNGNATESKTDVCKDVAALYHTAGFIECKPSMVFYKLNTWESKHVTAHLLARDGASEEAILKAFPYYHELVDIFDVPSNTSVPSAIQRRQLSTHPQKLFIRLQRSQNQPMVASSSSSSSSSATDINIPSLVPQVRSTVNATQPSVAKQPETPSPNTPVNETSTMGYEEIMQRMLELIEKQQQRHNEQMDRMFEMYQQSVTQLAATHRIIDTQLHLSLITQFREIGLTKSEILEQLRFRQ